jgi:hypothetical protein
MQLKNKTTKKLFYKKWLYKVVMHCPCVSYLCRYGSDYILKVDDKLSWGSSYTNSSRTAATIFKNKGKILEFGFTLEDLLKDREYQKRVESDTLAVFTNDLSLVEILQIKLVNYVTEIYSPSDDEQALFLQQNKNKVICEELPHNNYRFKIYFKNGVRLKQDFKNSFLTWTSRFDDGRILLPRSVKEMLENDHTYIYGQYFYAKDSKMTSMALMFMGNYLNRTEEYVLKSELV